MAAVSLSPANWEKPGLAALFSALDAAGGMTRIVGGAVRDLLAGQVGKDIDLATRFRPQEVIRRLEFAGIKAIPTGLAHGTVTAVTKVYSVEITTLRRDVATDGRRATTAWSDDWREDAARRDFTINALYADPLTGEVFDYFGGADDLAAGRVRFIGDPIMRIAEDHLRILRFFRFQARFGTGDPDADALAACTVRANDLMALSRERIADELLKLLALADPLAGAKPLLERRILDPVIPEIVADGGQQLTQLIAREREIALAPAGLRRLAALLPADPSLVGLIAARLKLSNVARKHLAALAGRCTTDTINPKALAYHHGTPTAIDRLLLGGHDARALLRWHPPQFPMSGGAIVARGIAKGPDVARLLKQVEAQWIDQDFPDARALEAIADAVVVAEKHKER